VCGTKARKMRNTTLALRRGLSVSINLWLLVEGFKPIIIRDADGVLWLCPPENMAGLPMTRHPDLNIVYVKSGQSLSSSIFWNDLLSKCQEKAPS
jgi:hypothetical protein